jgi:recombination protein RecR
MDSLEQLARLFEKFPGIGPRQATRFVQFLLRNSPSFRRELSDALLSLSKSVHQCSSCMRYHADLGKECTLCANPSRDATLLAIVATDIDLDALERSGTYKGDYFVLGGTISLASEKANGLRLRELMASMVARIKAGLKEVIIAFPANPEGDFTALHVRESLETYAKEHDLKISTLGRGLSTGSELEYADPDTIRAAFAGRS